jgi:quercetin dioxygenase-like cupin family protein
MYMSVNKISKEKAHRHDTDAYEGWFYQFPDVDGGRSVIYAEVTGDHGQRIIGDKPRIYYIFEGEGEFTVNGDKTIARPGDVIIIPPRATYSYFATKPILKLLLVMDLIDLNKLPPQKK